LLFNTIQYAVFFAVAFVGSWALARVSAWARIILLLAMSYGFYAAWDWRYLPLIFCSSTVDFLLARLIGAEERPQRRKLMLIATVVLNLGFLGFFKYWNFALDNVYWLRSELTGWSAATPDQALRVLLPPVGISFFTFESMSYVVDVYRRELKPHRSYFRYLLFVSFFPHLVAGPIVRPKDLLPQLEAPPSLSREEGSEGLFLIALGLLKKIVISDYLAVNLVDRVFERPENFSGLEVLCGVYGYAVQIYCDFSGYTDIAIGSALLLGIRFPTNFNSPYKAQNLADFWRRWHISLSTWLRDYLYIPLGGSRGSELLTYRNLLITMILGGLWHGASWTFVFWGLLHGVGLAVTRAFQRAQASGSKDQRTADGRPASVYRDAVSAERRGAPSPRALAWRVVAVLATFHYVCFAWVFFRAPTFTQARIVLKQMATLTSYHPNLPPPVVGILAIGFVSHFVPDRWFEIVRATFSRLPAPVQGILLFGVAIVLHEVAGAAAVPFVYFQF
jgi:D-alanyl-lipoteichoic acid acyltransferase DltB (MBOAT superfamily)